MRKPVLYILVFHGVRARSGVRHFSGQISEPFLVGGLRVNNCIPRYTNIDALYSIQHVFGDLSTLLLYSIVCLLSSCFRPKEKVGTIDELLIQSQIC